MVKRRFEGREGVKWVWRSGWEEEDEAGEGMVVGFG